MAPRALPWARDSLGLQPALDSLGLQPALDSLGFQPALDLLGFQPTQGPQPSLFPRNLHYLIFQF